MRLCKADQKRAADIRRGVAEVKKLQIEPPALPHLATALDVTCPKWGARPGESQQLHSRLMKLPAELRNLIVRLQLQVNHIEEPLTHSQYKFAVASGPTALISPKDSLVTRDYLHVMLACRRICREIQPIFFEENTFRVTDGALTPKYIRQLRLAMDVSAGKIFKVEIERSAKPPPGWEKPERYSHVRFDVLKRQADLKLLCKRGGNSEFAFKHYPTINAIGRKEVCGCQILKCKDRSGNDVMEFVEQYATSLCDPFNVAMTESQMSGRKEPNMTRCKGCKSFKSETVTPSRCLERKLASVRSIIYERFSERCTPSPSCSKHSIHSEKGLPCDFPGCLDPPTDAEVTREEVKEREAIWAAYRWFLEGRA